jgi:hypothetical protein
LQKDRIWHLKLTVSRTSLDSTEDRNSPLHAKEQAVLEKFINLDDQVQGKTPAENFNVKFQEVRTIKLDTTDEEESK